MAQHQGRDGIAAGNLDLRAGFARIHGGDQRAHGQQHGVHMGRQDLAGLHVGDVAALALVKAHQHLALLGHIAHRKARAETVGPGRTFDGAQQRLGLDLGQMPEIVFQHALLDGHLGAHVQMLHLAAAAGTGVQTEIRAAGAHALGRFAVDGRQAGGFPVVFLAMGVGTDQFGRQGAVDEYHLAIALAGHALGVHIHGQHLQPAFGQCRGVDVGFGQVVGDLVVAGFTHGARLSQALPLPCWRLPKKAPNSLLPLRTAECCCGPGPAAAPGAPGPVARVRPAG